MPATTVKVSLPGLFAGSTVLATEDDEKKAPSLLQKDIVNILRSLDLRKVILEEPERDDFVTVKLAPCYGKLTDPNCAQIDEALKIMVAAVARIIQQLPPEKRTWGEVVAAMLQNPALEPDGEELSKISDWEFNNTTFWKLTDKPNEDAVRKVNLWFEELVNDADVLAATPIEINELAHIVGADGHMFGDPQEFAHAHYNWKKTVLDTGVLRFPDLEHPYFKTYRIKLVAWARSECVYQVGTLKGKNGIAGEYHCRKFKPRRDVTQRLSQEIKDKAVQHLETFFG